MDTLYNVFITTAALSMIGFLGVGVVWLLLLAAKGPTKKLGKIELITLCVFAVSFAGAIIFTKSLYCDHEYQYVETIEPTCEKQGARVFHCDLCGSDKQEKIDKLGHDFQESRRTEPSYEQYGEIVWTCSRCGKEKSERVAKLKKPKETSTATTQQQPETTVTIETEAPETTITPVVPATSTPTTVETQQTVTYDEIYKAYKENELVANDIYKGNRYQVTAVINGISDGGLLGLSGGATLTMQTMVGTTLVFFYTDFDKAEKEALKTVKVGDTITFEGECRSAYSWEHCKIVSVNP